ncbi:MAG: entericidin A/B family lipoprotein [Verrucomicrobiales bacterium]
MKRTHIILLLAAALWAFATTGCNTFKGFGKDLKHAGEAIENT